MGSYNETGVLIHEENNSKALLSLNYHVTDVSIDYGVVNLVISIEICVVFEALIWSQKTIPYIKPSSEVLACFNFAHDKEAIYKK
jgi:hypothetical protein